MKKAIALSSVLMISSMAVFSAPVLSDDGSEHAKKMPTPDEQVAGLEAMCAASADARTARHAEKSLFERLGGQEKIHALTKEIVRLHYKNAPIVHVMEGVDGDALARKVAQFVIAGTGGPGVYDGLSMKDAHAHLKLTNEHFMAAGSDVIQAMKNLGHGEDEINEIVCILVSLRPQVVIEKASAE